MDVTKVKVDHPLFEGVFPLNENAFIVAFRVGRYIDPTPEAVAAGERITAVLKQITDADLALYRQWHGNVVQYSMSSKVDNPEVTDEMAQQFVDAAKAAFPDAVAGQSWVNQTHGLVGYSVRMHRKKENKQ